jgi:hypothetical protein
MSSETTAQRMKEYRARLRLQGLRPIQIWVYDQRSPRFQKELDRQVRNLNQADEQETLAFLEQVADWPEE